MHLIVAAIIEGFQKGVNNPTAVDKELNGS